MLVEGGRKTVETYHCNFSRFEGPFWGAWYFDSNATYASFEDAYTDNAGVNGVISFGGSTIKLNGSHFSGNRADEGTVHFHKSSYLQTLGSKNWASVNYDDPLVATFDRCVFEENVGEMGAALFIDMDPSDFLANNPSASIGGEIYLTR